MSIFDSFSKKVSETAKAAAKKSGDIVEVTRLNMGIGAEEDKIKKTYTDIGRVVYEAYASGKPIEDQLKELCKKVESFETNIEDMKLKILELRNVKECPGCGMELDIDMDYCFKCGVKQPVFQPAPVAADEDEKAGGAEDAPDTDSDETEQGEKEPQEEEEPQEE